MTENERKPINPFAGVPVGKRIIAPPLAEIMEARKRPLLARRFVALTEDERAVEQRHPTVLFAENSDWQDVTLTRLVNNRGDYRRPLYEFYGTLYDGTVVRIVGWNADMALLRAAGYTLDAWERGIGEHALPDIGASIWEDVKGHWRLKTVNYALGGSDNA